MQKSGSWHIATIGSVPIYLHWSFWILILWIVLASWLDGKGNWMFVGWQLLLIAGLVMSVILHELGHAYAASAFDIPTRDITMYPFGGVASIERMPDRPHQELVIALAGPAVNFLITAVIAAIALIEGYPFEMRLSPYLSLQRMTLMEYLVQLATLNTFLAGFNLLPAFPMDGGRVLRAFLAMRLNYVKATSIAATIGQAFAVIFIFLGFMGKPVLMIIGFFVFLAAENEKRAAQSQVALAGGYARDAVMVNYPVLPATAPLQTAIEALLSSQARSFLILDPEGRPVGTLSREQLISALHKQAPLTTPITKVMDERLITISADTSLSEVMQILQNEEVPFVLVEERRDSRRTLLGLIDAENIAEYLLIRKAREAFAASLRS